MGIAAAAGVIILCDPRDTSSMDRLEEVFKLARPSIDSQRSDTRLGLCVAVCPSSAADQCFKIEELCAEHGFEYVRSALSATDFAEVKKRRANVGRKGTPLLS